MAINSPEGFYYECSMKFESFNKRPLNHPSFTQFQRDRFVTAIALKLI